MKKIITVVLSVAIIIACALSLTACSGIKDATPEGIQKYGKLVVATNAFFPPFEYYEDGKIVGWDIDIAQALAEKLGVELVIENMEFDSVLLAPGTNKAHIAMAGISYSEERDKSLDFSVGVFNSSQVIIVQNNSTINGPFDLGGKNVGVQAGTVGQLLAEMDPDWAGEGDDAALAAPGNVQKYSTGAEAVLALQQDKVDAVIIDKYPAENFVANYDGIKICETSVYDDEYAFAVKEGNKALVEWINAAIAEMKEDGTFDKINEKYFGK
ncbi:MAG: transporter substrate-binding domain-containing protein [Clostridiales bacterium]|nr:transporter substrate-binding domain-containing protein [Clostridiales bacterium]